jgi:hypothetical protein
MCAVPSHSIPTLGGFAESGGHRDPPQNWPRGLHAFAHSPHTFVVLTLRGLNLSNFLLAADRVLRSGWS